MDKVFKPAEVEDYWYQIWGKKNYFHG